MSSINSASIRPHGKATQKAIPISAFGAIALWSTVASAFKISLRFLSPEFLLVISYTVSMVIFTIISLYTTGTSFLRGKKPKDILRHCAAGFLNPFLYYLVLFKAYSILPAAIAMSLNYSWPLFLAVALSLFKGKRLTPKDISGLLTGFTGVLIIALSGKNILSGIIFTVHSQDSHLLDLAETFISSDYSKGIILALFSALIWALSWILSIDASKTIDPSKTIDADTHIREESVSEAVTLFWNFLMAAPFMLFLLSGLQLQIFPAAKVVVMAIYVGFAEMGLSFILWLRALSTSNNPAAVANLANFTPFLSIFIISIFTMEKITLLKFAGLAMIICGNIMQTEKC
ncbi:MAG: hypothetical protein CVV64_09905 [Candidatus Wallbacteria bacterium HGW-Wallbacteria-1]|jgi:drug/metabolite transporter (DMT)-like permease|uniref:EamA domain-containing protein n=1 Tax=Candidatus Wallbacteria bacterium HGW-Wallbacteria-1 TaxID=2013854 RepID=A0A2N1PPK4_9BACT|nr:MAG: hypothetical protein CVV64_09905 [Candidatus Wallbacteria bacterium HGW-Wallbacteria-1]